jgi:hypothetical protein
MAVPSNTYRTRQELKLDSETKHTYDAPGEYTVVVKVMIFSATTPRKL